MEQLTSFLRALVAEGASVLRLRRILEWSLDAEGASVADDDTALTGNQLPLDPRSTALSDEQLLFSYVRLNTYASVVRAAGDQAVPLDVVVLDPRLEELVAESSDSANSDEAAESLGAAVRGATGDTPTPRVLVSSLSLRAPVRRLLERTMPTVEVVARQELPLGVVPNAAATVSP